MMFEWSTEEERSCRGEGENKQTSKINILVLQGSAMSAISTAPSNIAPTAASNHPVPAGISMVSLPVPAAGDISQEEIPKSATVKEFAIQDTDPGLWNTINTNTVDY